MKNSTVQPAPRMTLLKTALCLAFLSGSMGSFAGENDKLRQSPGGAFGGEIAAGADNPGLFGTAALTTLDIARVLDGNGADITTLFSNTTATCPNKISGEICHENLPGNKGVTADFSSTATPTNAEPFQKLP